jgi:ABC-type branched-subunit amino acid transport system ATPase component
MLLEVRDVESGYGETMVIYGVSLNVEQKQIVTIIGPNGSGKSTLLKTIFGIVKPRQGRIVFCDNEITGLRPDEIAQIGIGYVPQVNNIFPTLTVLENLEMGGYNMSADAFKSELGELLELFPILEQKRRNRAINLSGGERQMLAIARGLVNRPRLLLLDEPSAGLAPNLVDEILVKMEEIKERGTSILLVEQNAKRSLEISDRGCVMVMGKVALEDSCKNILDNRDIDKLFLGGRLEKNEVRT